jgi:hypothetical protein
MPAKYDRVSDTSTTTGAGDLTLDATPPSSYVGFSGVALNTPFNYTIEHASLNEFEVGIGYLTSATVLVRQTIETSSNGNALVNFSAGTKNVFITVSAATLRRTGTAIIDFGAWPGSNEATVVVGGQTGIVNIDRPRVWVAADSAVLGDGDIYFNNTKLLLHGGGTHGSPVFIDNSAIGSILSIVAGTPTISTAQSLFGGSSIYMPGNAVIAVPFVSGVNTLSDTCSIEFGVRLNSGKARQFILDARTTNDGSPWCVYADDIGSGNYLLVIYHTAVETFATIPTAFGSWNRFGIFNDAGITKLMVNGFVSNTYFGNFSGSTVADMYIGGKEDISTYAMDGYLDEVRITNGVCRQTANYTLATGAFQDFLGGTMGHTATDHRWLEAVSGVRFSAGTPTTGSGFTIYAHCPHKLTGEFEITYSY